MQISPILHASPIPPIISHQIFNFYKISNGKCTNKRSFVKPFCANGFLNIKYFGIRRVLIIVFVLVLIELHIFNEKDLNYIIKVIEKSCNNRAANQHEKQTNKEFGNDHEQNNSA